MTAEKMKRYPGMVIVKKETEARLGRLRREIEELECKVERAERKHESRDRVVTMLAIKEERRKVTEALLEKIESSTMEVEEALAAVAPELTPLEMIIVTKLYIEGMRWNELMDELQTKPEYSRYCYERSTYMRAHRSALDKLTAIED
ncbi:MAG: hypothetical protein LUG52_06170 [Clostridia bacterium]|nr:hypothetical protein [Clostridia bacterium]